MLLSEYVEIPFNRKGKTPHKTELQNDSDSDLGFRAIFVPFQGEKCVFLQVFVPRVLIFKKLHLLLHSKMEVQGKNGVKNH